MATPSERLLERLTAFAPTLIPEQATIRRTYAGRVMRQAGAWSWEITSTAPQDQHYRSRVVGSYTPVTTLLRAPRLIIVRPDTYLGTWTVYDTDEVSPADLANPRYHLEPERT